MALGSGNLERAGGCFHDIFPTMRIPPPTPNRTFVEHLSFCKRNVANAPQWGQHIYTNPHGGASGKGQYSTWPWDKIKILFND